MTSHALEHVARTTWELARQFVFPGGSQLLREFADRTIYGGSTRVEFRLQQDRLGSNSEQVRTMVAVRLVPTTGAEAERPPTLFVHGYWPERTDRLARVGPWSAKRLRRTLLAERSDRTAAASDDIYIMESTPLEDLTAQIALFVVQTESTADPERANLFAWLETYLCKTFRIPVRERREVARDILLRLIKNKWLAEDPRAWRQYVAKVRTAVMRGYTQAVRLPNTLPDPLATEDRMIQVIEGKTPGDDHDSQEDDPSSRAPTPFDPTGAFQTVQEAADYLGVGRSTLYRRIQRRAISVRYSEGRMIISRAELQRLLCTPRLAEVIRAVAVARFCSVQTARRYVSRCRQAGRTLGDILQAHRPR